jgi:predicted nucleic acid-binding protein
LTVPPRTVLLDTSYILALENKDDPHHQRARDLDAELLTDHAVLLLHWGILLELGDGYARVGRRAKGLQLLAKFEEEDSYRIAPITDSLLREARTLYHSRHDKDRGLTDCVSFALMAREGVTEALTADESP